MLDCILEVKVVPLTCVNKQRPMQQINSCPLMFHVLLSRKKNNNRAMQEKLRISKKAEMQKDMKCTSLNVWITNNTSIGQQFSQSIRKIIAEDPGHQSIWCGFQTYLGRKELRQEKEDKRKQDKTCALGWDMVKQGRDFQNEANPFTKV